MFSSRNFSVPGFTLRSLILLVLLFVPSDRYWSDFILFCIWTCNFPSATCWRFCLFYRDFFNLCQIPDDCSYELSCLGLITLFHSIDLHAYFCASIIFSCYHGCIIHPEIWNSSPFRIQSVFSSVIFNVLIQRFEVFIANVFPLLSCVLLSWCCH